MDRKAMSKAFSYRVRPCIRYALLLALPLFLALQGCGLFKGSPPRVPQETRDDAFFAPTEGVSRVPPKRLGVNRPVQVTFASDPVRALAVSRNGTSLLYITERQGLSELALLSLDPAEVGRHRLLVQEPGILDHPAFSPDGRWIAFTGTSHDVKGDIFLLDLEASSPQPIRVTGRATADGGPCFSPDGQVLYFHATSSGQDQNRIHFLPLKEALETTPPKPRVLDTQGDAIFPALSPDGRACAFVSFREHGAGDVFVLELSTGRVSPWTSGPDADRSPTWSHDGKHLYFSRVLAERTGLPDAQPSAQGFLHRMEVSDPRRAAWPLSSPALGAQNPALSETTAFFLSRTRGMPNVWSLPLEGQIPTLEGPEEQMALALEAAARIPAGPWLTILAYSRVLERFQEISRVGARAAYALGGVLEEMGRNRDAEAVYGFTEKSFQEVMPEAALAGMRRDVMATERRWLAAASDGERNAVVQEGLLALAPHVAPSPDRPERNADAARAITSRSHLEAARILSLPGAPASSLVQAMEHLDQLLALDKAPRPDVAQALFQKAELYGRLGQTRGLVEAYVRVLEECPEVDLWADRASRRILDVGAARSPTDTSDQHIERLSALGLSYRETLPRLAMAAWNRVGDIHYEQGEWALAKAAYRTVLDQFPMVATQTAAARLALAEILYREERFRQALDLYETEMSVRPYEDRVYGLARRAYVQRTLDSADYLLSLGEAPSAQGLYLNLIREDYSLVRAHRGFLQTAAARKQIPGVLTHYRNHLARHPQDPVTLYATGLCLTYLEGEKNLMEALSLLEKALALQGQTAYFYQTLGYVHEVLETVYRRPGHLEKALDAYQRAYFLNNVEEDPKNTAHLALNLGNIHFLLNNFHKAFDYYTLRLEAEVPFPQPDAEILFYRRYGAAAFQVRQVQAPIQAYERALALMDQRMDPKAASEVLGRVNRFLVDRIIRPALKMDSPNPAMKALEERQASLSHDLFTVTALEVAPPPDPSWEAYRTEIGQWITAQEGILRELAPLLTPDQQEMQETLEYRLQQAREALGFPQSLVELKAELLDRLGLAYQSAGQWKEAREAFGQALDLNRGLGLTHNLAANQRSVAYNAYQEAEDLTGREREEMLTLSLQGFQEVVALVDQYGTAPLMASRQERPSGALVSLEIQVALDQTDRTEALHGFSPEQEKRLARTFAYRIETELGNLGPAREEVEHLLSSLDLEGPVPARDLYGTALLFHRGGHMAFQARDFETAFERFRRSADLCVLLNTPVSTAMNVLNMAQALVRLSLHHPLDPDLYGRFMTRAKEVALLLHQAAPVLPARSIPQFHNSMGVLLSQIRWESRGEDSPAGPAIDARLQASLHLMQGLQAWDRGMVRPGREDLALLAGLHLNLAALSLEWEDPEAAVQHFSLALETSRRGWLPQYQWRALAGLGHLEEALEILQTVPLVRSGCQAREITRTFARLVHDRIHDEQVEEALNLLEALSELERVHVLQPLVLGSLDQAARDLTLRVHDRLLQMGRIQERLETAQGSEAVYLAERLQQEERLLSTLLGEDRQRLPAYARMAGSLEVQDAMLMLVGAGLLYEKAADEWVERSEAGIPHPDPEALSRAREAHDRAVQRLRALRDPFQGGEAAGLFLPDVVEAIDLMEGLPLEGACIRILPPDPKGRGMGAILVTPEHIRALEGEGAWKTEALDAWPRVLICEDPGHLPHEVSGVLALNAGHFLRSLYNRKPFKSRVLALNWHEPLAPGFQVREAPLSADPGALLRPLPETDTLLANTRFQAVATIPARPGQVPREFMAMELDQGRTLALDQMADRLTNVSLVVLPQGAGASLYALGHLLSLLQTPTVLIPGHGPGSTPFVASFFDAYATGSVQEARIQAEQGEHEKWIQMGFWGLTPEEATDLARERFADHIRAGVQAYGGGRPEQALVRFENGLILAREDADLSRHLPQLLAYARESAFAAHRIERAAQHAEALVELLAQQAPLSREHAEALLTAGLVEARLDRYEKAVPLLEEAVDIFAGLDLEEDQIQALGDLGIILENATHYHQALEQFESAASLAGAMDMPERVARQHQRIGRIHDLRLSQYALAKQSYLKALAIYEDLNLEQDMAQAMLDLGRCSRLLGNFPEAEDYYEKALLLAGEEEEALRLRMNIRMEQANNAWFQGRYQEAFALRQDVFDAARANGWLLEQVMALNTSGLTWWTLGDHDRALRELEQALELTRDLRTRQDERASTLNNMGLVYRDAGQYEKALQALDQALTIDRAIRSAWAIAYDLKNKALTYLHMGLPDQAVPLFEEALETAEGIGNQINMAKILLGYGETLLAMDRIPEGKAALERALDLSRVMVLRETQWQALYALGRLRLEAGAREGARDILYEAMEVIEGMRAEIKLEQLKDGYIANKMHVYETLVSLLKDMGQQEEAFVVAERSRARNLIDLLGNQRINLHGAVEQERYDQQKALQAEVDEYQALVNLAVRPEEQEVYQEALNRAQDRYEDLMLRIQAENPWLSTLVSVDPLDLPRVQALLEPGVALLVYYVLSDEILAWLIDRDAVQLLQTPLPKSQLGEAVLEYRRMLQNLEPLERASRKLHEWLVSRAVPSLGAVRFLGIVPHDTLHHLSFGTLEDGETFLADRVPLFYLPSASVLKYTLGRRGMERNTRILAIGNPDLQDPALDLPFAQHEVGSIRWNFPEITTLTGERATESWVARHMHEFGIIHMATHGEFDPINPLFSAIKLVRDDEADGDLQAAEIFGLKIEADLVVLSACQTGLGKVTGGDDVIGMNRAFLYAGTHAVMSSLWRVSDISTSMLIKQFYREYTTLNKAESLRRAMLHVKTQYPHPGYWGAFVMVGDYE